MSLLVIKSLPLRNVAKIDFVINADLCSELRDRHSMPKNKNAMTRYQILDEFRI